MENQQNNLFVMKVIWGAMAASQFVYTFLVFNLHGAPKFIDTSFESTNEVMFLTFGFVSLVASFVVFKILAAPVSTAGSLEEARTKFFVPFVVRLVLIESCCIYGLVLSFTSEKNLILPFFIPAFLAIVLAFPTDSKIQSMIKRMSIK